MVAAFGCGAVWWGRLLVVRGCRPRRLVAWAVGLAWAGLGVSASRCEPGSRVLAACVGCGREVARGAVSRWWARPGARRCRRRVACAVSLASWGGGRRCVCRWECSCGVVCVACGFWGVAGERVLRRAYAWAAWALWALWWCPASCGLGLAGARPCVGARRCCAGVALWGFAARECARGGRVPACRAVVGDGVSRRCESLWCSACSSSGRERACAAGASRVCARRCAWACGVCRGACGAVGPCCAGCCVSRACGRGGVCVFVCAWSGCSLCVVVVGERVCVCVLVVRALVGGVRAVCVWWSCCVSLVARGVVRVVAVCVPWMAGVG